MNSLLSKYKAAKCFGDRFSGKVKDGVLVSANRVISDHNIGGSDGWKKLEFTNKKHRLQQWGALCYQVEISLPISIDIIASCLHQDGYVISVDHVGRSTQELITQFMLHDHKSSKNCSETCRKAKLEAFLEDYDIELGRTLKQELIGS